ncbi:MAG: flagellar biosynthetic protein FliO [Calditrichaeota bacterium]|nr:MAG: flagellar biosynthetic protein FliO [Calditrichota bacterium]
MKRGFPAAGVLFSSICYWQSLWGGQPEPPAQPLNLGWAVAKMVIVLVFIIGLIFLTVFFLKRLGLNRGLTGQGNWFRMLGKISLQPKQAIALVQVLDRIVLLGITEQSIRTLAEFPNDPAIQQKLSAMENSTAQTTDASSFWKLLKSRTES